MINAQAKFGEVTGQFAGNQQRLVVATRLLPFGRQRYRQQRGVAAKGQRAKSGDS